MQKFYVTSLLVLIILLTYILTKQIKLDQDPLFNKDEPIEYMKGLKIYNYDYMGRLKNYIFANTWQFSMSNSISIIKDPAVTILKFPNYLYKISAAAGQIQHNKVLNYHIEVIKLFSEVLLQQQYLNDPKRSGFNLHTDYLEFNPNTEIASTSKKVTIQKPGLNISGTGMEANLKTHEIALQHNVISEYNKQAATVISNSYNE